MSGPLSHPPTGCQTDRLVLPAYQLLAVEGRVSMPRSCLQTLKVTGSPSVLSRSHTALTSTWNCHTAWRIIPHRHDDKTKAHQ